MASKPDQPALVDELMQLLTALSPNWQDKLVRLSKSAQFNRIYGALSRADADKEARAFNRRR